MWTGAGANQPVHWFLGGKGLGIQQGTSVWVGSPKSVDRPPRVRILTLGPLYFNLSGALSKLPPDSKPSPEISGSVLNMCRVEKAHAAPLVIQPKHKGHGSVGQRPSLR